MTAIRRCAAGAAVLALVVTAATPGFAADCLEEIEATKARMQAPDSGSDSERSGQQSDGSASARAEGPQPFSPSGPAGDRNEELESSSQANHPTESWQGATQTDGSSHGSPRGQAYNPEAAKWLDTATELAQNGKIGGCWQTLVQARRILGLIPADAPLPEVE